MPMVDKIILGGILAAAASLALLNPTLDGNAAGSEFAVTGTQQNITFVKTAYDAVIMPDDQAIDPSCTNSAQ